jgi:hypothetical protein
LSKPLDPACASCRGAGFSGLKSPTARSQPVFPRGSGSWRAAPAQSPTQSRSAFAKVQPAVAQRLDDLVDRASAEVRDRVELAAVEAFQLATGASAARPDTLGVGERRQLRDQDLRRLAQRGRRTDRPIGLDLERDPVVVAALPAADRLDGISSCRDKRLNHLVEYTCAVSLQRNGHQDTRHRKPVRDRDERKGGRGPWLHGLLNRPTPRHASVR